MIVFQARYGNSHRLRCDSLLSDINAAAKVFSCRHSDEDKKP